MATQLTDDCRAIAADMHNWSLISGNLQLVNRMAYESSGKVEQLRLAIQDEATVDPAMVVSLVLAHVHASNVIELTGVIALHPLFADDGVAVAAAADWLDAVPPPEPEPPPEQPEEAARA
jgi:hypothetical protein